ncbi:permease [Candidatus Woesearchaeota archaeon]|nr:permease [Candidatus Woesearchaeota archaeon]
MNLTVVMFAVSATALYAIAYLVNPRNVSAAFSSAIRQLFHPAQGFAYIIFSAFLIASLLVIILPKEQIALWLGRESGLKGILLGTLMGALTPGGPFLTFPILVAFWKAGAGAGTVIAYLTAWSLFGINRVLVWELPFFGPKFVALRIAMSFVVPILLGVFGGWLFSWLKVQ